MRARLLPSLVRAAASLRGRDEAAPCEAAAAAFGGVTGEERGFATCDGKESWGGGGLKEKKSCTKKCRSSARILIDGFFVPVCLAFPHTTP